MKATYRLLGLAALTGAIMSGSCVQAPSSEPVTSHPGGELCSEGYVESLYHNVLGRDPDKAGLEKWQKRYEQHWTRRKLALSFLRSKEWRTNYIHEVFLAYLRRSPTAKELKLYIKDLRDGHTEEDVIASVVGSDEYFEMIAENGKKNFVTRTYEDILERPASGAEVDKWSGSSVSDARVANRVLSTKEYKTKLVTWFYGFYLNRSPEQAGLDYWVNQMLIGTRTEQIRASFLSSEEYYGHCAAAEAGDPDANAPKPTGKPCGNIGRDGVCSGDESRALYCEDGQLFEETCPIGCDSGLCLDDASDVIDDGGGNDPMFECAGGVTENGSCGGSVLTACDAGEVFQFDCASEGKACAVDGGGLADCFAPPTPCGAVPEEGICEGNVNKWCDDGKLDWSNCGLYGWTCQVDADGYADCVGADEG